MASKTLKTRLKQKRDSSANWAKATNFTPLAGEIIVYSDLNMIKIGDGSTKVSALPFLKGDNASSLAGYVPYTGATKDVDLGNHSLLISNKSGNTGNPTIKISAKVATEDDVYTSIGPSGITIDDPGTTTATLNAYSLGLTDGVLTVAIMSSGFKAHLKNGTNVEEYSIYTYDGINHNGKKLSLPTKEGTIALISDIPSLSGYVPYSGGDQDVTLKKNNSFVTSYEKKSVKVAPDFINILNSDSGENNIMYDGMHITDSVGKVIYTRRGITADGIEWLFPSAKEATGSTNVFVVRDDLGTQATYSYDSTNGTLSITTK